MTARRHLTLDHGRAAVILCLWAAVVVWLRWDVWAPDLSALLIAGWLWEHGQAEVIYAMPPGFFGGAAPEWSEAMALMGVAGAQTYPYLYPPIWAVLVAPLTKLWSIQALMNGALLVQVPLLAGSVVLAGRLAKPKGLSWTLWALWGVAVLSLSAPAYLAVMHNQPSILMGFVILLAFERLAAGRPVAFGALIAVAAAIKLSPALFILAALMTRSGRAVAAFGVAGAGLGLASVVIAGWPAHEAMLTSVATVSGHTLMIALNLSLQSVLGQVLLQPEVLPASAVTPMVLNLISRAAVVIVAGLLLWRAHRWTPAQRPLGALLGLSLVIWLLGPLGWLHYYVVPLLVLPGLALMIPRRLAIWIGGATVILSSMPVYLALAGAPGFHALYPALAGGAWLAVLAALLWPRRV